ncbi:MAG TPA: ABC transporter permease [Candidatus Angelobacter sp.]|nr:ABC transporter permease [Candidatus Angelobacter sp.]
MKLLDSLRFNVAALFQRAQVNAEMADELRSHIQHRADDLERSGLPRAEAERRARIELGGIEQIKERVGEQLIGNWLHSVVSDCGYGLRQFRKNPSFTTVAVLTLALGIGANTAIFSVVDGVLLQPLPYRDSQELYRIREIVPQIVKSIPLLDANLQNFLIWQKQCHSFSQVAIAEAVPAIHSGDGPAEEIYGLRASASLLDTLGIRPAQGRAFLPEEDLAGHSNVVLLTDAFWRDRFHRDPSIIGRHITLDGQSNTIVGVLPSSFRFPKELSGSSKRINFYKPLGGPRDYEEPLIGEFDFVAIARLLPGVTPESAVAELNVLQEQIAAQAKAHSGGVDLRAEIFPLADEVVGSARRGLLLLLAAVVAVLLIVCVNLANLCLSRAPARMREAAIRTAVGATRSRLIRQMLLESLLLAFTGGLLGMGLANFALQWLLHAASGVPRIDEVAINYSVLLSAVCLSGFTGIFFGILPALTIAKAKPQPVLKSSGSTSTESPRTRRLRGTLVALEVGLCTLLLIMAGLLSSSLFRLARVNPGFAVSDVIAADVDLPEQSYTSASTRQEFYERALTRIRELPGVHSTAWVTLLPLGGQGSVTEISLPGEQTRSEQRIEANFRAVSPEYFDTMRIPLVSGRYFTPQDRGRRRIILSQNLAQRLWPGADPIGKQCIGAWGELQTQPSEVVGVVGDIRTAKLDQPPLHMAYLPDSWAQKESGPPSSASIVVRGAGATLVSEIREVLQGMDPNIPVVALRPMTQLIADNLQARRFQLFIACFFAASALLLASVGIFGVVGYSVEQRRQELGLRRALGAQQTQLLTLVLGQGMLPVVIGLLAGTAVALASAGFMQALLFEMNAFDPVTFTSVALLIATVSLLASYIPARRATRVDPMVVLRYE